MDESDALMGEPRVLRHLFIITFTEGCFVGGAHRRHEEGDDEERD